MLRHLTTSNINKNQNRKLFSSEGGAHFTLVSRNALWPHYKDNSLCLNQGKQKYAILKGFRVFCCDSVQFKRFRLRTWIIVIIIIIIIIIIVIIIIIIIIIIIAISKLCIEESQTRVELEIWL